MAKVQIVQMKGDDGTNQYPKTRAKAVEMGAGKGTLEDKLLELEKQAGQSQDITFTERVDKRINSNDPRCEVGAVKPNGRNEDSYAASWRRTPFLACMEGGVVTIFAPPMYNGVAVAFYSNNNVESFISSKSTDKKGDEIPIPKGTKYFRASLGEATSSYCTYTESINKKPLDSTLRGFQARIDESAKRVDEVADDLVVTREERTIQYKDLTEDNNGGVNKKGVFEAQWGPNWRVTPYTLCIGGSKMNAHIPGLGNYLSVSFYREQTEESFIKAYTAIEFAQDLDIPIDANYFRASLCEGSAYVKFMYEEIITDVVRRHSSDITRLDKMIKDIPGYVDDAMIQATWEACGTSITWYNDHVAEGKFTKGYLTRVNEIVRFRHVINQGYSGSPIGGSGGLANNLHHITKADYYTVEHGINDWGESIKVGTIEDFKGNTGIGTFYGAYRLVIDKIYALNPNAKVILCTPRKAYGGGLPAHWYDANSQGIYFHEYADAVIDIAKFMSFPVCDWFYESQANQVTLASLSIDSAVHPNDPGYQDMANLLIETFHKVLRGNKVTQ